MSLKVWRYVKQKVQVNLGGRFYIYTNMVCVEGRIGQYNIDITQNDPG